MKTITLKSFFSFLFLAVIAVTAKVDAAAKTASQSGDWGSTSTWGGSAVPTASDDVTITGFTVTVSTAGALAKSITVQTSATVAGKLIIQSGGTLTASTSVNTLTLKGGEVENAGSISLTTTDVSAFKYCISYENTVASTLLNSGKYSGAGSLILNSSTSTSGGAINFIQSDADGIFTVGGSYTFSIAAGRPLFNVGTSGKGLVTGTGTITVGTSGTPAAYGLTILAANNAQLTIDPNVIINVYTSINTTKRGPIYFAGVSPTTLTNKGTINIEGSGTNAIGSVSGGSNTLVNEGNLTISGAFTESAIGVNLASTNVLYVINSGTISISGLSTSVPALATPGTQGYFTFTNNTNGVLDINAGSTGIASGSRTRLRNYGGTIKGSGIFNGSFEPSTGTISPGGNGLGKITIAQLNLLTPTTNNLTGNCILNVNGKTTAGTDYDQIAFTQATVNVAGATLEMNVGGGYIPANNDEVSLITAVALSGNFSSVTMPSLNWAMDYATSTAAKVKFSSTASTTIASGYTVVLSDNLITNDLTINSGGTLTVNPGKQLTINTTFSNSGTLNLLSSSADGTATIITPATISESGATNNVLQYISSSATGLTGRNWYISSPLSAATSSTITTATGNDLVYYDGTTNWPAAPSTLVEMKGYIAKSPAQNTTINFTGGTLNTGDKSVSNLPLGFNLVGNPYASYVDWSQATKTAVSTSIWYRSKSTGSYLFQTYNVAGEGVSVNGGTNIIPPMQSFWIKTTSTTNTLGFTNLMRSHQDQSVLANRLKAPKASTQQLLRLQVSNSLNTDETVIYFNPNAQNVIDEYDTQKMFNNINNVPEIFTKNANTNLVINGMTAIPYETEIPVGFSTGEAGNFNISRTELKNFDANTKIMLKDKLNPTTEFDLTDGQVYNFSADITSASADRFSILFRAPVVSTSLENLSKLNAQVFVNAANKIVINTSEKNNYAIYNGVGQLIENGRITSNNQTSNHKLVTGVYVVKVGNQSTRVIVK